MDTRNWEVDQYGTLINQILGLGERRSTRAGDTYSLFGRTMVINVEQEFPLLRGRKMFYKPVFGELAAMVRGPKHVEDFKEFGCNYWEAWGAKPGDCLYNGEEAAGGELNLDYGNAWIDYNGVNQLADLIEKLKTNPTDRRLLISGWRPDRLSELSLPCCHLLYQWYVRDGKYLDMIWYQRSVDVMVGLPSDIILAAAWNIMLAAECGYTPGNITFMLGDTHIYTNHVSPALEYMRQLDAVKRSANAPISYELNGEGPHSIFNFTPDSLSVRNYQHMPPIKFELNV